MAVKGWRARAIDITVGVCGVLYGLAVGGMVLIIMGLVWMQWGW